MPIMCSRIRTLSARIFRASLSCCTASPWTAPACLFRIVFQMRSGGEKKQTHPLASYLVQAFSWLSFWPGCSLWAESEIMLLSMCECVCILCSRIIFYLQVGPARLWHPGVPGKGNEERERKKHVRFLHFYPLTNLPLHPISSLKSS